jgi:hypothetical protein
MNEIAKFPAGRTDVEDFIRRGGELYVRQTVTISEMQRAHAVRRAEIEAEYAKRMSDVADEGIEKLRLLDQEHARTLSDARAKLEAIGRLRDG